MNSNSKIHSQQTMPFSAEDRAAIRSKWNGQTVQNTNGLARQVASVHPQTHGAQAFMETESEAPRPIHQASPRVMRQHGHQGSRHDPGQGPVIDPQLVAALQGQGPQNRRHQQAPRPPQYVAPAVQEYEQPQSEWFETPRPRPMAAPMPDQVPNPMPGYVIPISDHQGSSLALPSRFAFYDFKDIYVRPFFNAHLSKLQRAHTERSMQPVVEVVSTVVYSSDPSFENLAFDLTMPDFFAVLYWLRLNSFTKMSFVHKDVCRNPDHLLKVKNGELDEDSLRLKVVVDRTTLKSNDLEVIPDPQVYDLGPDSPYELSPPRMRDVLEFLDHPYMKDPKTRVEFSYFAQQASHLRPRDGEYHSLDQRIEYVEYLDLDQVSILKGFETMVKGYGIEEYIHMNCKVCGASRKSNLVLDASSFLSFE